MEVLFFIVLIIAVGLIVYWAYNQDQEFKKKAILEEEKAANESSELLKKIESERFTPFEKANESDNPYFLIVDTDADGFPDSFSVSYKNLDNWPRIQAISWILLSEEGKIFKQESHFLRFEENDISTYYADKNCIKVSDLVSGEEPSFVYDLLIKDLNKVNVIVAHNIDYHLNMIRADFVRFKKPIKSTQRKKLCTMNNTAEYVGIWNISKGDYKFPTLAELVTKIFYPAKDPEFNFVSDIDTSQQQVFAVAKCLVKLLEIGRIEDQYH